MDNNRTLLNVGCVAHRVLAELCKLKWADVYVYGFTALDDEVPRGTLYTTMKRMEVEKLLLSEIRQNDNGGSRRYYRVTTLGKQRYKEFEEMSRLLAKMANDTSKRGELYTQLEVSDERV